MLKQVYRNVITGWLAIFLGIVVNILITPLVLNHAGKVEYGIWILVFNVIGYLYLADFGVTNAISRIYAKYNALNNLKKLKNIVSISYLLIFIMDVIVVLIILGLEENIFNFLDIDEKYFDIYTALLTIGVVELSTQLILRINYGLIQAKHRFDITFKFESLTAILRLIGIMLLFLFDSFDIVKFALVYSFSKLVIDLYSFVLLQNEIKNISLYLDKDVLKEMVDIGSSSIIISLSNLLLTSLPILMFGKLFGLSNVFLYSIPFAIMTVLSRVINMIYVAIVPKVSELKALNQSDEIFRISKYGTKVSYLLGFLFLSFFIFFGKDILYLWLGDKVLNNEDFINMYNNLILLLVYLAVANLQKANNLVLKSSGLHWYATIEIVVSAIILLLFSYVFFEVFQIYIFTVGLILVGVFNFLFYKLQNKIQTFSISFIELMILFILNLGCYVVSINIADNISYRIYSYILVCVIFITFYWFVFMSNDEKEILINRLKRKK